MSKPDIRLAPPLSAERRAAIPEWVGPDVRATLDAPERCPIAALLLGARIVRSTAAAPEDRAELGRWIGAAAQDGLLRALVQRALDASSDTLDALMSFCASSPEARSVLAVELGRAIDAHDAAEPPDSEAALAAVQGRDEIESAAWVLGLAVRAAPDSEAAVLGETRVLEAAAGIDEIGQALRTELARALRNRADEEWLESVARLDDGWWLDAWSQPVVDVTELQDVFLPPASNVVFVHFPAHRLRAPMAAAASSASSAMDRALEVDPGPVLARLLGGAVEVYAVGLDDEVELPVGLVVRVGEAARFDDLESVRLDPPGTAPAERDDVAEAWWVPLGGVGGERRALVVQLGDGRSGRLEIEPE